MNNQMTIESSNEYSAEKVYTLYVNPVNRHITGMIGFAIGVEMLNDGNNFLSYNIDDLTETEYYEISRSIGSTEAMTFLDEDNRTIHLRRILIDLLEDTLIDTKNGMIFGLDNIINFRVRCVDENLNPAPDVQEIQVKNIKKSNNPIALNGKDPDFNKVMVSNPSEVKCELLGEGVHTVKIKAKVPGVDYLWLTAYPQMIKLSGQERENVKNWLKSNVVQPA